MNTQDIATAIRRADLSFADMAQLISAIECRLAESSSTVNTEDAAARLCQAIDELGRMRDYSQEQRAGWVQEEMREAA